MFGGGAMLAMLALAGLVWALPVALVTASRRASGVERAVWALVCAPVSWLGYVAFLPSARRTD